MVYTIMPTPTPMNLTGHNKPPNAATLYLVAHKYANYNGNPIKAIAHSLSLHHFHIN